MNFDLNIDNYEKSDLCELFNIEHNNILNENEIQNAFSLHMQNIQETELELQKKEDIKTFLKKALDKIMVYRNNDYKLINNDFTPDLEFNKTVNEQHFIIKKSDSKNLTSKINPLNTSKTLKLLNINTLFRKNYYNEKSANFLFELPNKLKNVIQIKIDNVQLPMKIYNVSDKLKTNTFVIETFDLSSNLTPPTTSNRKEHIIKIKDGYYNPEELADYLNRFVFQDNNRDDNELQRIACSYDNASGKFRFFRDFRNIRQGGMPEITNQTNAFNIDWRVPENTERPIQMNLGWILGYRKQYYSHTNDYIVKENVNTENMEGYNAESQYFSINSKYILLSIDDFNNNFSNNMISPFQDSNFIDNNIIAKIPYSPVTGFIFNSSDFNYEFSRDYFGPVNIEKLKIKLLDEFGRVIDLNNCDYSLSIVVKQLYDQHEKNK